MRKIRYWIKQFVESEYLPQNVNTWILLLFLGMICGSLIGIKHEVASLNETLKSIDIQPKVEVTVEVPTDETTEPIPTEPPTEATTEVTEETVLETTTPEPSSEAAESPTTPVTEHDDMEVARKIWDFGKAQGWSDEVCAGILGNVMSEVGGQTFDINPYLGDSFYGICQWSKHYFPAVNGKDLDFQLQYLSDTLLPQFGSKYGIFMDSSDPASAAKMFAIYYERCDPASYGVRQQNAKEAYDKFAK